MRIGTNGLPGKNFTGSCFGVEGLVKSLGEAIGANGGCRASLKNVCVRDETRPGKTRLARAHTHTTHNAPSRLCVHGKACAWPTARCSKLVIVVERRAKSIKVARWLNLSILKAEYRQDGHTSGVFVSRRSSESMLT